MTIPVNIVTKKQLVGEGGNLTLIPHSLFFAELISLTEIFDDSDPIEEGQPIFIYIVNEDDELRDQVKIGKLNPSGEVLRGTVVFEQTTRSQQVYPVWLSNESYQKWKTAQQT